MKFEQGKVRAFHLAMVADEFGDLYVHLTGIDGMTNYFHFLIVVHFSYYLIKYGNLYKYSQQGWERVNGKAKRSYHHNTQKGGGKGGSSKLLPIVRMFNRELFRRFKHGQKFFEQKHEQAVKYGKVLKEYFASEEEIQSIASTILNMGSTEDIYGNDNDVYEAAI